MFLLLFFIGCSKELKTVYSNENNLPVKQGEAQPFSFEVYSDLEVVKIRTFHWNDGKGAEPGEIILSTEGGKQIGKWKAEPKPGREGVESALWEVEPDITLKPGRYTVKTSDSRSWSFNEASGGIGFTSIYTKK
ncbi:MAG: hypothetical protein B6D45_07020 [Ignavibacteriales bacterium UTCHB3]|nr:MAG: hypothetical protein B6D45_07020 [Ignavibacteriales bacterium UTCHB3]